MRDFALASGLLVALTFVLVFPLTRGLDIASIQKRMKVNAGLKQSAIYAGALTLSLLVLLALTRLWLHRDVPTPFAQIATGVAVSLSFDKGAGFCLKNLMLRYELTRAKCIPWRYEGFLYFSVERVLMVRQGGSFRFIHRMLQEHLASDPPSTRPILFGACEK